MPTPVEGYIFNMLLALSTICTVVLLAVYIKLKRNPLIASCSILILAMSVLIFVGQAIYGIGELDKAKMFCFVQAASLNYVYIAVHALICFMMVDHCLYAFHIKIPSAKNFSFSPYYFTVAFAAPLIPTVVVVSIKLLASEIVQIEATAFYCVIVNPIWLTVAWLAVFGLLGMSSAILLLKQTIWRRDKMIKFGNTTHFPRSAIIRLTLKVFVYCFLCLGSFLPILIFSLRTTPQPSQGTSAKTSMGDVEKVPSVDEFSYDETATASPIESTFSQDFMFPSFIPSLLGLGFFAMYGVSSHALQVYRKIYRKIMKKIFRIDLDERKKASDAMEMSVKNYATSRRNQISPSTAPLDEDDLEAGTNEYSLHSINSPEPVVRTNAASKMDLILSP